MTHLVRAAALLAILALAACGRPEGVLIPTGNGAPGAKTVDMLVITTREPTRQPGVLFSGERAAKISATNIRVSIPPDHAKHVGQVQWPEKLPANPATDFTTVSEQAVDPEGALDWFRVHSKGKRHVLLFIHGFNNSYEDAVYRFAQIVHDSGTDAVPILFTWPSRASVFAYNYDRESTTYSRDALEDMMQRLAGAPEIEDVSVLAHSMGSFLTLESLRQMAIRNGRITPKISNVILAAPDVDVDVFKQQLGEMGPPDRRPRFTIFTSTDDRALKVSSRLAGSVPRLGAIDPKAEPYCTELHREKIQAFNLKDIETDDVVRHDRFTTSAVVKAIGTRIVDGQDITESDLSLGERVGQVASGLASTAGGVAGAVLNAPLAIVDPNVRRNYGDRIGAIGGGINDTGAALAPNERSPRQAPTDSSAAPRPSNSARTACPGPA